jgi:hypothetical protein
MRCEFFFICGACLGFLWPLGKMWAELIFSSWGEISGCSMATA